MTVAFQTNTFYNQAFAAGRELPTTSGSIVAIGNAATFAITMPVSTGLRPLTGFAATTLKTSRLPAATGAIAGTYPAATFGLTLPVTAGAYAITVRLGGSFAFRLVADTTLVKLTGFVAGGQKAMVPRGILTLTGNPAGAALTMPAETGLITIGGFQNARSIGRQVLPSGAYPLGGRPVNFRIETYDEAGTFPIAASDAAFAIKRFGYIGPVQVIQHRNDVGFSTTKILGAETARYSAATRPAYLLRDYSMPDLNIEVRLAGHSAILRDRRRLTDEGGAYIETDYPVLLIKGPQFSFSDGINVMTVPFENWVMRCA